VGAPTIGPITRTESPQAKDCLNSNGNWNRWVPSKEQPTASREGRTLCRLCLEAPRSLRR